MSGTAGQDHLERAQALRPLLLREAEAIERGRRLTPAVVTGLVENGLYRMLLPKSIGGAELDPPSFMRAIEEIAKGDASTAWCLCQCAVSAMVAAYMDPAAAEEIFNTPPGILAWGAVAGEAQLVDGGCRVSWRWHFASGCRQASWLGAHVQLIGKDGQRAMRPDGRPLQRTILFPAASARIEDVWDVIGLKGTGTDDYAVDKLFVPDRFIAGRDDPAARREAGPLYKLTTSIVYGLGFSSIALGLARMMLDAAVELAGTKSPRQIKHALRDNHAVHALIGRNEAKLRAARAYLFATIEEVWRDLQRSTELSLDHRVALRLAASWALHQSAEVVDAAYHMAGATAVFRANPFERRFRDMHAVAQQIQARDVHYETVGQVMLGLEPDAPVFAT